MDPPGRLLRWTQAFARRFYCIIPRVISDFFDGDSPGYATKNLPQLCEWELGLAMLVEQAVALLGSVG
jgi:hypothetical protein